MMHCAGRNLHCMARQYAMCRQLKRTVNTDHLHCTGRQLAEGRWVVVKTHYWSQKWDPKQADHVFLTHRELSEVVDSYKRVGWAFSIPDSYVREHKQWQV